MYSDGVAANATRRVAKLRLLVWVNIALFVGACAMAVAGIIPRRENGATPAGLIDPMMCDHFSENFGYRFALPSNLAAVTAIWCGPKPFNVALVYVGKEHQAEFSVQIDGKHVNGSDFVASEIVSGGRLVAIGFKNQLTVELGGASVSLDLTGVERPQRVGVDTSVLGMRLVYLRAGEEYL